jgi:hypothetical protein
LRQAAIALLAVPIILAAYLGTLLRRSMAARVSVAIGLAFVVGIGAFGGVRPVPTAATPAVTIAPLTQSEFTTTVETGHPLTEPVTIHFTAPMDPVSVAAAVTVDPATPVNLTWDPTGTALRVSPKQRWLAGTFHTVTVASGALARSGQPLARPARAVFLTRGATTASIAASRTVGERVAVSTAFMVSFARPVEASTVMTAIRLDPPTPGVVQVDRQPDAPDLFTFVPTAPLRPDANYRLVVAGVRDLDGLMLSPVSLEVRTQPAATSPRGPSVVRFRPQTRNFVLPIRRQHQHRVRRGGKRPSPYQGCQLAHTSRIRLGKPGVVAAASAPGREEPPCSLRYPRYWLVGSRGKRFFFQRIHA